MVYNEDWAGIFHDDVEYHDGPPNRQSSQLWPAQMDPENRNHICNQAMIKRGTSKT
jgi:hypothetical protein